MTRPVNPPGWATDGGATRAEPTASKRQTGYATDAVPTAQEMNAILGGHGDWLTHLDGELGTLSLASVMNWSSLGDTGPRPSILVVTDESGKLVSITGQAPTAEDPTAPHAYYSADGGRTWTAPTGLTTGSAVIQDVSCVGSVVIACATTGLYRSTDGGATWTQVSTADTFRALAYSPSLARWVCVASLGNVYRSDDAGATWTASGATGGFLESVTWSASAGCFVALQSTSGTGNPFWRSADGITWTRHAPGVAGTNFGGRCVAAVDLSASVRFVAEVVASGGARSVVTSADGQTWTGRHTFDAAEVVAPNARRSIVRSTRNVVAMLGYHDRVMTSADGITWTARKPGGPASSAWASASGTLYAGAGTRIYRAAVLPP